jgi:hypothetical protein
MKSSLLAFVFIATIITPFTSRALDDPNSLYVKAFLSRAQPYEGKIDRLDGSRLRGSYADYERFLNDELNKAYVALFKKLGGVAKNQLKETQKNWSIFRDSEFQFISDNWTKQEFGSSYSRSVGDYRTTIIKNRTLSLLYYLENYSLSESNP